MSCEKHVDASTIARLIEAHVEKDEQKFFDWASFIADAYAEAGEKRSARIIRSRIDGSYKNQTKAVLDSLSDEGK